MNNGLPSPSYCAWPAPLRSLWHWASRVWCKHRHLSSVGILHITSLVTHSSPGSIWIREASVSSTDQSSLSFSFTFCCFSYRQSTQSNNHICITMAHQDHLKYIIFATSIIRRSSAPSECHNSLTWLHLIMEAPYHTSAQGKGSMLWDVWGKSTHGILLG